MFSANENLILRQSKKRVVAWVEECIPEAALDAGVNVMVMQEDPVNALFADAQHDTIADRRDSDVKYNNGW